MAHRDRFWPRGEESKPRRVDGGLTARSQRGAIGDTWWSQRFIAVLERYGVGGRMQRGRAYARRGQVLDLTITPGRVRAGVQGSRAQPYRCQLAPAPLTDVQWATVLDALGSRAAYAARLLAGEMPPDIEEVFDAAGAPLFPARWQDVQATCSCPDWENPCKHLAAVLYLLAERFDQDPFEVLTWRGRERSAVLDQLRTRRGVAATAVTRPAPWWPDGLVAAETSFWGDAAALPGRDAPALAATGGGLGRLAPLDRRAFNRPVGELLGPAYARLLEDDLPAPGTE